MQLTWINNLYYFVWFRITAPNSVFRTWFTVEWFFIAINSRKLKSLQQINEKILILGFILKKDIKRSINLRNLFLSHVYFLSSGVMCGLWGARFVGILFKFWLFYCRISKNIIQLLHYCIVLLFLFLDPNTCLRSRAS